APHTKRFWPMLFQFICYIPRLCRAVETARERTQVCRGWQVLRCVYFELPFATALRGSSDGSAHVSHDADLVVITPLRFPLFQIEVAPHSTMQTNAIGNSIMREWPAHPTMPTRRHSHYQVAQSFC